ncbi:MAG: hypothetical protein AB7S98_22660, partial [Burkholderiaceae bacterium]
GDVAERTTRRTGHRGGLGSHRDGEAGAGDESAKKSAHESLQKTRKLGLEAVKICVGVGATSNIADTQSSQATCLPDKKFYVFQ